VGVGTARGCNGRGGCGFLADNFLELAGANLRRNQLCNVLTLGHISCTECMGGMGEGGGDCIGAFPPLDLSCMRWLSNSTNTQCNSEGVHPNEVANEVGGDGHGILDAHREPQMDQVGQLLAGEPDGGHSRERLRRS